MQLFATIKTPQDPNIFIRVLSVSLSSLNLFHILWTQRKIRIYIIYKYLYYIQVHRHTDINLKCDGTFLVLYEAI